MHQAILSLNTAMLRYIRFISDGLKDKRILDIGCGTGFYTYYFGKKNHVAGIDLQSCVGEQYKNFRFQQADATALPFKTNTFDVAISFDVIEHVEHDFDMIKEAYRVLKRGGQLIIGTPNRDRLIHLILKYLGRPVKYPLYIGSYDDLGEMIHVREYTNIDLKNILVKAGFSKIEVEPFWLGLSAVGPGLVRGPEVFSRYSQYLFAKAYK